MNRLNAADYGIAPGEDITKALFQLLEQANRLNGDKTVFFEKGTYYIDSEKCRTYKLYITNTVGDREFSANETPHLNAVPFYFGNAENLTVDGNGAIFIIDGKVTNMALENCRNVTLKNLEIRHAHPDMHELKVIGKTPFTVDFEIDCDSKCRFEDGTLYFYGKDYDCPANKHAKNAHWIGLIRKKTPDKVVRVSHPLLGMLRLKKRCARTFRAYYPVTLRFRQGDRYYLFDVRRQFAGIFINKSENIKLENIKQRFNYSLALVAQDSENISVDNVEFAPEKDSARRLASVADFIQICMCRGKVSVTNSLFDGAGDDCLNVHGIHFKIQKKNENQITVRFMHPQSHGFNPLRTGDTVAFIDPKSLLENGRAVIRASTLLNEYEIELTLDCAEKAVVGEVIEDVSACPDVTFANNTLTRIITRACLFTTRGSVLVKNNRFISNSMSGILLSDDAKSWYESGMCREVTVQGNIFDYCGKTPVLIKPENVKHSGAVHKNICITDNVFKSYKGVCVYAKSSENIVLSGNRYSSSKHIQTINCDKVQAD